MTIFSGVDSFHEAVRDKIRNREPGWAQSDIGGSTATYSRWTGWTGTGLYTSRDNPFLHDQLDEMLLDVARGEGQATDATFHKPYVERKIEGLKLYASWNLKPHAQAKTLEDFFINGPGASMLYE